MTAVLRSRTGAAIPLEVGRWRCEADEVERSLLAGLPEPVLDIGCGPGRIVAALGALGRVALGIDTSALAVQEAGRRGAAVLHRSVFDHLPGERRWGAAVLLDGNIGIGGDPIALLRRVGGLLRPRGQVLVEVAAPGEPTESLTVRLERSPAGGTGPWFPWARVAANDLAAIAAAAGLVAGGFEEVTGRWFALAAKR